MTRKRTDANPPPAAARKLILDHLPLLSRIAVAVHRKLPAGRVDVGDLVAGGYFGLDAAARSFDPARGVAFGAYARVRILGAMRDALRAADWAPRWMRRAQGILDAACRKCEARLGRRVEDEDLRQSLGMSREAFAWWKPQAAACEPSSLDAPVFSTDAADPVNLLALEADGRTADPPTRAVDRDAVHRLLRGLLPDRRAVMRLYYLEGLPLKEVGRALGVSESRASQIRTLAIRHLRETLSKKTTEPESEIPKG